MEDLCSLHLLAKVLSLLEKYSMENALLGEIISAKRFTTRDQSVADAMSKMANSSASMDSVFLRTLKLFQAHSTAIIFFLSKL